MDYSIKYSELRKQFKNQGNNFIVDEFIEVKNLPFHSENKFEHLLTIEEKSQENLLSLGIPDSHFTGNNQFLFPVFIPRSDKIFNKAIILLHGLNERFWDKYLPWAYYLALYTNRPVILFPLSFHMNRAPEDWANPKKMSSFVEIRKNTISTEDLTFVNLALSCRLSNEPLRFMKSGYQSAKDLIKLTKQIENGNIPFLKKDTKPDFFAYSIGAFVSQILLLANPDHLYSNSRFFLFCGGAFFKDMYGVSKLIMDKAAYTKINNFYTTIIDKIVADNKPLAQFLDENNLGKAFYAMLKEENNKNYREHRFLDLSKNIFSLSLLKDKVIPAFGVQKVMDFNKQCAEMIETMNFPYEYTHETPFPISSKIDKNIVDFWFSEVFKKAADFFNMAPVSRTYEKKEERVPDEIYL